MSHKILSTMADINTIIKDYLDYLAIEKNRSPKTVANYRRYLDRFANSSKLEKVSDLTENAIREFRITLARAAPAIKKVTQAYYVIVIRSFLKYLAKRDFKVVSADKIELPKIPQRQIQIVEYGDL